MTVEATKANMDLYYGAPGVGGRLLAWSPTTGEEFSANPADYWDAPPDWCQTDHDGQRMLLAVRLVQLADVDTVVDVSP